MGLGRIKIGARLWATFGLLIALMTLTVIIGITRLVELNQAALDINQRRIPILIEIDDLAYRVMDSARITRSIILLKDDEATLSSQLCRPAARQQLFGHMRIRSQVFA